MSMQEPAGGGHSSNQSQSYPAASGIPFAPIEPCPNDSVEQALQLRADADELPELTSQSVVAIVSCDPDGVITSWNPGAEKVYGYTEEEAIGMHFTKLVPEDRLDELQEVCGSLQAGKSVRDFETVRKRKDGSLVYVSVNLTPVFDPIARQIIGLVATARDVSQKTDAIAEMQSTVANQIIARETLLQKCILNVISHELRTPLAQILGMNELLRSSNLSADQQYFSQTIQRSAEHLLDIVNEFILMAQIESGQIRMHCEALNLEELVERCVAQFKMAAVQKGLSLDFRVDPNIDEPLWSDRHSLEVALRQLISNAIKFTSCGGIMVRAELNRKTGGREDVQFMIDDTGEGISPQIRDDILLPFIQGDLSRTRRYGGAGLGLSIAKGLVELMGGKLGLEPRPEIGTRVWFELPFSRGEVPPPQPQQPSQS